MASSLEAGSVAYINGRVYTVNSKEPWADAFIVSPDGLFAAIGSTVEITAKPHQYRPVISDLRGDFVMPGIHDAHVHMLMSGTAITSQARLPPQGLTNASVPKELKKTVSCADVRMYMTSGWSGTGIWWETSVESTWTRISRTRL